jgi:hypothetical protein
MPYGDNRLSDKEKRTVLKMRSEGYLYKEIAIELGKTIPQLSSYVRWRQKNNGRYVATTVSCGEAYIPSGKRMPPINPPGGIRIIKLTPVEVEAGLSREYGDRLAEVKMPLADRQGVAATIFNGIY